MRSPIPLVCPQHGALIVPSDETDAYRCPAGCMYPIVRGIPRFVRDEGYAASFGLQWNVFRRTQLDSHTGTTISRDRLARIAGGSLDVLAGKLVLEAGCGAGRFTEVMLAAGARVFATDISSAVDANYANCAAHSYFICQADLTRLPVRHGQFDVVVCIGVVQHTPDPEQTMSLLCEYLKPGGLLLIDHYPPGYALTPSRRLLRAFLLRRSSAYAMRFCEWLVTALWPVHRALHRSRAWPLRQVRSLFLRVSPLVDYHDAYPQLGADLLRAWALLDTHDTLTDHYKHLRSRHQIEAHLRSCGMDDIRAALAGNGVEVRAMKPLPAPQEA